MASPMRGKSCMTTRPAPMLRCPTSELPICPGGHPRLPAEHRAFSGEAPVIAGERTALADHAMARHHERYRVFSDSGADSAGGTWRGDPFGELGVGGEIAHRDFQKRVPHPN